MFKSTNKTIAPIILLASSVCLIPSIAAAESVATVIAASGTVQAVSGNQKRDLQRGSQVSVGDEIITGANGRAQIRFSDNGLVSLSSNADYRIDSYEFSGANDKRANQSTTLVKGKMMALTGAITKSNSNGYKVKSKFATIGISGTEFATEVTPKLQTLAVYQGTAQFRTPSGVIEIGDASRYKAAVVTQNRQIPEGYKVAPKFFEDAEEATGDEVYQEIFDASVIEDFFNIFIPGLDEDALSDEHEEHLEEHEEFLEEDHHDDIHY